MYRFLIGIVGFVGLAVGSNSYSDSIEKWHAHRDAGLRSPNGWLTLVGLFWLNPGDNTIGSGDKNDFVLPKGSAPVQVGTLRLDGKHVTFRGTDGSTRTLRYEGDNPDVVHAGSVSFFVIQRGEKFAIRAKDSASPVLKNFGGMKYFPTNPEMRFQATFIKGSKQIPILNILGKTDMEESPGVVEFTYGAKQYHLRPITEGDTLFFLFKDTTNKTQTYQPGRMLNTPMPVDGKVDLDFNRSYNPPCTFTPYATCPLPPKENALPFAVTAGELRYDKAHEEYTAKR